MRFEYEARNPKGEVQSGMIEAASKEAAFDILGRYDLVVTKLERIQKGVRLEEIFPWLGKISKADLILFLRILATLFGAGIPIRDSLRAVAKETTNVRFQEIITVIADEIEGGAAFHRALSAYPDLFTPMHIQLLRAGETVGRLPEALEELAEHLERDYNFDLQIKGALMYPAIVFVALVLVFLALLFFVIPSIAEIAAELGQELPLVTRMLIGIAHIFVSFWYIGILLGIGMFAAIRMMLAQKQGKLFFDRMKLSLPVFGELFKKAVLVRFCMQTSTLIRGGVPIVNTLEIVSEVAGNEVYRALILEAREAVKGGASLHSVFSRKVEVPSMLTQMVHVGEKTGNLSDMLEKAAAFYQRDLDRMLATLSSLIAPMFIVVLGIGVGLLLAGILAPLYGVIIEAF